MKRLRFFLALIALPNIALCTVWFLTAFAMPIMEVFTSTFWEAFSTVWVFSVVILSTGLSDEDVESFNNLFKW